MITLPKSGLKLVEKKSKRSSFEIHPVCVPFMSKMAIVTLYIFPKRIFLRNSIKKISSKSDEQQTLHIKKQEHSILHLGISCLEIDRAVYNT